MLKKSLWDDGKNFLGPLMRLARGDMRDHIVSHKKRPLTFVTALQSFAAVRASRNQLSRDFRSGSIFEFCNSIEV